MVKKWMALDLLRFGLSPIMSGYAPVEGYRKLILQTVTTMNKGAKSHQYPI